MIADTSSIEGTELHGLIDSELTTIAGGRMHLISAVPPNISEPPLPGAFSMSHPDRYWLIYHQMAHELTK